MPDKPSISASSIWESLERLGKPSANGEKEPVPVIVVGLSELLASERVKEIVALLRPKVVTGPVSRIFTNRPVAFSDTDKDQDVQEYNFVHVDVLVSGTTPVATLVLYAVPFGARDAIKIQLSDPAASQVITANKSFDCPVGSAFLRVALEGVSGTFATGQGYTVLVTPYNQGGTANGQVEQRFSSVAYSTAQTATTIKSGAGFLHSVTILGGTAGAITVWDNTAGSGTTILPAFTPASVDVPVTILLDVVFSTGLTFTTSANTVIQFSYR